MDILSRTLPGEHIKAKLSILGVTQAQLAAAMRVSKVRINQMVHGHAPITPQMALRLARVTETEPEFWLGLQTKFELDRWREKLAIELDELRVLTGSPVVAAGRPSQRFLTTSAFFPASRMKGNSGPCVLRNAKNRSKAAPL